MTSSVKSAIEPVEVASQSAAEMSPSINLALTHGAPCGRQVCHFQVEMTNSEGGFSIWQDMRKYRLQEAQDHPVFLTLDIRQR